MLETRSRWVCRRRSAVAAVILLCGIGGTTTHSQAANYVLPDGRTVRLDKSTTELGIVLRDIQALEGAQRRMAVTAQATLESFNDDPDCPVRILRVPDTNVQRRSMILQDPSIAEVRPVYRFATARHPVVGTGTLIAKVQPHLSDAERDALWAEYGVAVVEPITGQPDVYKLAPLDDPDTAVDVAERLAGDPRTEWAQPNFRQPIERRQVSVGDSLFAQQWHLNNTGQSGGQTDADIDALEAWGLADGQDILFGMFDDAADIAHEDLREGYIGIGHDPTLSSNNPGFDDPRPKQVGDNHGTRVLGLAVARGNELGVRGVSFQSRWTASRGLNGGLDDAGLASVFTFALQQSVDVHINSWGLLPGTPNPAVIENQIKLAFRNGRNKGNLDDDEEDTDDPLGMVIVFAAGNDGILNEPGFELSTIPEVLSVGASNDIDVRASYSNFGDSLNFLAPSGDDFRGTMFTTDNTDREGDIDFGANVGGVNVEFLDPVPELDTTGSYTGFFSGTSAACPVAAGVAGLVLSVNPLLTVTDVRMILEHTTDRIDSDNAAHDPVTGHSQKYGYGRLNADAAVQAAVSTLTNGGRTWPSSAANVNVQDDQLRFRHNEGADQYLVVQSDAAFDFTEFPKDGACYDVRQLGCAGAQLTALPNGVTVLAAGCGLRCGAEPTGECEVGDEQCVEFTTPAGRKFLALYGYNSTARHYSFGVAADSDNNVRGSGLVLRGAAGGSNGGGSIPGGTLPDQGPAVTIQASPLEGLSPLTVTFKGNAVSAIEIDESEISWDFGDGEFASMRNITHTYEAPPGETKTFVAQLTMIDVQGAEGHEQVAIQVSGPAAVEDGAPVGGGSLRIIVSVPGSPGSDVDEGASPFDVLVSVDAGTLTGSIQSIVWDMGDGTRRTGLTVPHTYVNETEANLRFPITATVSTTTTGGSTVTNVATKLVTVLPGTARTDPGNPVLPGAGVSGVGGGTNPCGAVGMIPLFACVVSLTLLRRRRF